MIKKRAEISPKKKLKRYESAYQKAELKKTDQVVNQKMNELKALQKKAHEEKVKRIQEEEKDNESKGVDVEAIKDWIHQSTDQLLKQ